MKMQFLLDARSSEPLNIVLCLTQQPRNNARGKGLEHQFGFSAGLRSFLEKKVTSSVPNA